MLRLRADVNGKVLGEIIAVNMGHPVTGEHPLEDQERRYRWDYIVNDRGVELGAASGTIKHNRDDGWMELAAKIIYAILNEEAPQ